MAGVVETTHTFATNEVITSTLMNNIIDETLFTADALTGTTLALTSGKLKVATTGITSNEIAANAITTTAILDANVTPAKLSNSDFGAFTVASGVATLDNNVVTTAKIASANVTTGKIADANVTAAKLDGAQTGSAPIFGVRAWVVFDMTKNAAGAVDSGNTTRFIPAGGSGNVTSVTKTDTGAFTVAFTTVLPSANYAYSGSGENDSTPGDVIIGRALGGSKTTSTIALKSVDAGGNAVNFPEVSLMFIG
jgi:hypothetical protein